MVAFPHDVLLLIAEYFEPSELLSLAAFHRYFLHDFLNRRYHDPVVLTHNLENELKDDLETDISRIGGPLACKLIQRLELRTEHVPPGGPPAPLRSRLRQLATWSPIPPAYTSFGITILRTFGSLTNLRSLHLTEVYYSSGETFIAPRFAPTWVRLLPDVWTVLAPRLEELHMHAYLPLLQAIANLDTLVCRRLSTLCIDSRRIWKWHNHLVPTATSAIVHFMIALSPRLEYLSLSGDKESAMPKILEGVQQTQFPRLYAFDVDLIQDRTQDEMIDTFSSCANFLLSHGGLLRSLSIRPERDLVHQRVLLDFLEHDCGVTTSLRRLDLDLGDIGGDWHGVGPAQHVNSQRRYLDSVAQLRGLKHLVLRQNVMWSADPVSSTGVVSAFSPRSTFRATPRTFKSLRTLSFSVLYLRAQVFEDLAEAAPRLEEVDIEFTELWCPITGGGSNAENVTDCASRYSRLYTPKAGAAVFVDELKMLHDIENIPLRQLQLRWWSTNRNNGVWKEMMLAAIRKRVPSLHSSKLGLVQFIEPRKRWEQDLQWMDGEGCISTSATI